MKNIVFLLKSGTLSRKNDTICLKTFKDKKEYFIPIENTSQINILGNVDLNKNILEFASKKEIILNFFSYYGRYVGSYFPKNYNNSGNSLIQQVKFYIDEEKRLVLAKSFVRGAYNNIVKVLLYYKRKQIDISSLSEKMKEWKTKLINTNEISNLLSIEAHIRENYYSAFDKIINKEEFKFEKRTRRPPENFINTLISFGNSLLYATVLSEIYKTKLDPRIGFLHYSNSRCFSLHLDIAEIFKPIIVDRIIFTLINRNEISEADFFKDENSKGVFLNENGMRKFVGVYDDKLKQTITHKKLKRKISYRGLIIEECYKIYRHIMNQEKYKPFVLEW